MDFVDENELEAAFKAHLEKKGIRTFGPLLKHYLNDGRGTKHPHAPRQQPHGRRPGKRVLMTGIRALAKKRPDLDLPKWNDMLEMEHNEVLAIFEKHFGEVKPAKGANQGVVRVVENDPKDAEGFKREEERARSDAQTAPAAGKQGQNLRVSQFPVTAQLAGAKEKDQPRDRLRPKARRPGKDVVDYHRYGAANEGTRAERAGAGAPAARGPYNRNPESMRDAGAAAPTKPEAGAGGRMRPAARAAAPAARPAPRRRPAGRPTLRPRRAEPVNPGDPVVRYDAERGAFVELQGEQREREIRRRRGEAVPATDRGEARAAQNPDEQQYGTEDHARMDIEGEAATAAKALHDGGVADAPGMKNVLDKLKEAQTAKDLEKIEGELERLKREAPDKAPYNKAIDALVRGQGGKVGPADGPRTAAAREAGVPDTEQFRNMGTQERVQFREYHQNREEVNAAQKAAQDEIDRNVRDGKNTNILRVGGRYLDVMAFNFRGNNGELTDSAARLAAEKAIKRAENIVQQRGGKFKAQTDAKKEEWVNNLAQRFKIRVKGAPEGDEEVKRARQMDKEEQFREGTDQPWQRGGRVRDKLKEPEGAPKVPDRLTRKPAGTATDVGAKLPEANTEQRANNARVMAEAAQRLADFEGAGRDVAGSNDQQKAALQAIHYGAFDAAGKKMYNNLIREANTPEKAKAAANNMRRAASGRDERQKKALLGAADALSPMPDRLAPGADQIAPGRFAQDPKKVAELEKKIAVGKVSKQVRLVDNDEDRGGINAGHMHKGKVDGEDVLLKHRKGDGVEEYLGAKVAQAMGLDKFFPVVGYRADEDRAVMQRVGDEPAASAGVTGFHEAVKVIMRQEGVDKQEATDIANMLVAYDAVLANTDRHMYNARVGIGPDGKPNALFFIDAGFMGRGHRPGGAPNIRGGYSGFAPEGRGKIPLSPELRKMLEGLDDNFFEQHAAMFRMIHQRDGAGIAEGMKERVKRFLDQGFVDYNAR